MDRRQKQVLARLFVGAALNVPLYFVVRQLALWSTIEREFRLNLIAGCLGIATLVFVTPVFWRGAPWQAALAFVLVFYLPGIALVSVVATILKYW
jgi:hypothetical protein